ncbi:MAG: hypothetical protein RIS45_416, partial [Planctomycetota bacterium]
TDKTNRPRKRAVVVSTPPRLRFPILQRHSPDAAEGAAPFLYLPDLRRNRGTRRS